ncbi:hypothetical protein [Dyella acidiphila]|uniref:Uncharacterized protein n=1 Tax=Dyella acidiphila TaxID=2775866 RepID=A0ABR9GCN6_9GAMM|nr:hypothetical protein [Dyella acidiphila]MBE1161807.1 hypothetical protein [Dyella acidiphila]
MRVIPVQDLVVEITAEKVALSEGDRWRGHWSVHPGQQFREQSAVAEGDTDLQVTEENAYLFAGTQGVAMAKDIAARRPGH